MFRSVLLLVSALTTGASLSRKYAGREIERRKEEIVEAAADTARERIRKEARSLVVKGTRIFLRRILIKALVMSAVWFAYYFHILPHGSFGPVMGATIGGLVLFDIVVNWPTARLLLLEMRKHGLRPRRALGEVIAVRVFEEVLAESDRQDEAQWHEKVVLSLAGKDRSSLSREIAESVAEITRETSWRDLRPFIIGAGVRFAILMGLYSGFAYLIVVNTRMVA